jgi:DNA-binding NtrC family response regulator
MALVLVVDDEPEVRQLLGRVIRTHGHEVVEAESADAALAIMAARAADVVFTDIQMPGHDGRWLTMELRKRYPATPVVLATSVADLEPAVTLKFGVLSYLVKPFDLPAVGRALKMAVDWRAGNPASGQHLVDERQLEAWLNSLELA